jgi:RNA polymerase sigma-B factor
MNVSGGPGRPLDSHNGLAYAEPRGSVVCVTRLQEMALTDTQTAAPGRRFLEPAPGRARADAELLARYRGGDESVRADVIERFLPLARQLARRYARGNEPLDDLFQVASVGLLKAIDRYDPARGYAFSTFAVPTIVGELKRYFRDTGWAVHVPRPIQDRIIKINRAMTTLAKDLERSPTTAEIASALECSVEDVVEAIEASGAFDAVSLETPRNGEDGNGGNYAETVGAEDQGYEMVEYAAAIAPTMNAMPARDRLVLRLRFEEDLTQSDIATRLGISQMHVSRIIRRSLARLRTVAEAA